MTDQMLKGAGGEEIRRNGYRPASAEQVPGDFAQFVANDQKRWKAVFEKTGVAPSP